jgi:bis(5'-nucleosidyl)-tetraphosphatase
MVSDFNASAGVVVLRYMDGDFHVLCLETKKGKYDLTKGIIDPGETALQAAIRESREEAGITNLNFIFGETPHVFDRCTMFVAVTDQDPEILPNPYTGIKEHTGYVWLPILDAINSEKIKNFLQPAVLYAYDLARGHTSL